MRLHWVIPCLTSSVDRFLNTLTITHMLEQIQVQAETPDPSTEAPVFINPGLHVVGFWSRTNVDMPETFEARCSLVSPRKRILVTQQLTIDLSTMKRVRHITRFGVLPYVGPGDYTFVISAQIGQRWRKMGRATLEVTKAEKHRNQDQSKTH